MTAPHRLVAGAHGTEYASIIAEPENVSALLDGSLLVMRFLKMLQGEAATVAAPAPP
jgi:hypothetical protein